MAAGLAGAAVVLGFAVAGVLLLAGVVLAGVGWRSLRTRRTTAPSIALGAALGFVGATLLTVVAPSGLLLVPVLSVLGGALGHRLAPDPPAVAGN